LRRWPKRVLWGVAPTGPVHFGYAPHLGLLRIFASHGSEIILLIANYHGFLDSNKTQLSEISKKTQIYKQTFIDLGVPKRWLIETNEFYFTPTYFRGLMEHTANLSAEEVYISAKTTLRSAAASNINKTVGDIIYVATQIYDVKYLDVDCVMSGLDEADIYRYGLPKLSPATDYVYLPPTPGLLGPEMHSCDKADNILPLRAAPTQIASAFGKSDTFRQYHCNFTLPLLNGTSSAFSVSAEIALFKLIRGQK